MIVDRAEFDLIVGEALSLALMPTPEVYEGIEAKAAALVRAAAKVAGYDVSAGETDELIRLAVIGETFKLAGGVRKGIAPPERVKPALDLLESIRKGDTRPPDMKPSPRHGIGGSRFSATRGARARAQKFSRDKTRTY